METPELFRQTGRTTRMLLRALGDDNTHIMIMGFNSRSTRVLMDKLLTMLSQLGYDHTVNKRDQTITCFNKIYTFRNTDSPDINHVKFNLTPRYKDEI